MNKLCPHCNFIGSENKKVPGSFLLELFIWGAAFVCGVLGFIIVIFFVPALILAIIGVMYSFSRKSELLCPKCELPGMIPIDTPKAQQAIQSNDLKVPDARDNTHLSRDMLNARTIRWILLAIFLIYAFFIHPLIN